MRIENGFYIGTKSEIEAKEAAITLSMNLKPDAETKRWAEPVELESGEYTIPIER